MLATHKPASYNRQCVTHCGASLNCKQHCIDPLETGMTARQSGNITHTNVYSSCTVSTKLGTVIIILIGRAAGYEFRQNATCSEAGSARQVHL